MTRKLATNERGAAKPQPNLSAKTRRTRRTTKKKETNHGWTRMNTEDAGI